MKVNLSLSGLHHHLQTNFACPQHHTRTSPLTPAVYKSSVVQHITAGGREKTQGLAVAVALTCSCQWKAPNHRVQCGAPWLTLGAVVLQLLVEGTNVMYDWSYFIAWIGVGWTLISALLFSGASVCLRSEREREDAKNMAYLMPGNAAAFQTDAQPG